MDYQELYSELFKEIENKYGPIDEVTLTSVIGFSGGGPVSLSTIEKKNLYVTCELSVYPEQHKSSENLNYELFSAGSFNSDWCRSVLTALGNLAVNAALGDEHTIDISGVVDADDTVQKVKLRLFSKIQYEGNDYGIYEVLPS